MGVDEDGVLTEKESVVREEGGMKQRGGVQRSLSRVSCLSCLAVRREVHSWGRKVGWDHVLLCVLWKPCLPDQIDEEGSQFCMAPRNSQSSGSLLHTIVQAQSIRYAVPR